MYKPFQLLQLVKVANQHSLGSKYKNWEYHDDFGLVPQVPIKPVVNENNLVTKTTKNLSQGSGVTPSSATAKPGYTMTPKLRDYLWFNENGIKTGFNPKDNTWSPYDDNGTLAIGPGLQLPGLTKTTKMPHADVESALQKSWMDHRNKTLGMYPGLDKMDQNWQDAFTDLTYNGAGKYKDLFTAVQENNVDNVLKEYKRYHNVVRDPVTKKVISKEPLTQRNNQFRDMFINPYYNLTNNSYVQR